MDTDIIKIMHNAIVNGNIELIKKLLDENDGLIDYNDIFGSWLQNAAIFGHKKAVEFFIDQGMDVNAVRGKDEVPIITDAAGEGHSEIVKMLYNKGAELDVSTMSKNALFHTIYSASRDKNKELYDMVKLLVELGIDITVTYKLYNGEDCDAVLYAYSYHQHEIENYLRERLAERGIKRVYRHELTALIKEYTENGDIEKLKNILDENKFLIEYEEKNGSWLHFAIEKGQKNVIEFLIDYGMDVNKSAGDNKISPLNAAVKKGDTKIIKLLLDKGAKTDTSKLLRNPLFTAIYYGQYEAAKFLINNGIDITVTYEISGGEKCDAFLFANIYGQRKTADYIKEKFSEMGIEKVYSLTKELQKKEEEEGLDYLMLEEKIVDCLERFLDKWFKEKNDICGMSIHISSGSDYISVNANSQSYLDEVSNKGDTDMYLVRKYSWGDMEFQELIPQETADDIADEIMKIEDDEDIDYEECEELTKELMDSLTDTFKRAVFRLKRSEIFKKNPDIYIEFFIEEYHSDDDMCDIFREINGDKYISEYIKFLKG
ncbi:MAG: ankyrin repeat domain-containing protein [Firmicutes bacterium]|nr:ankyrin repeat domain-containing protein [Bacillota bacterium]